MYDIKSPMLKKVLEDEKLSIGTLKLMYTGRNIPFILPCITLYSTNYNGPSEKPNSTQHMPHKIMNSASVNLFRNISETAERPLLGEITLLNPPHNGRLFPNVIS